MNIPDEAVDAAAKQMAVNDGDLIDWVLYQSDAKRVLEAAAPYVAERIWDIAYWIGREDEQAASTHGLVRANPYRSQA